MLIMDDMNKPQDTFSEVMRNKVKDYYDFTLLSRLNNSEVPIINIQQRLHIDDISAYVQNTYNFNVLKTPLIKDGKCQFKSQYTDQRIKELHSYELPDIIALPVIGGLKEYLEYIVNETA